MNRSILAARQGEGHLWAVAFGLSLLLNGLVIGLVGFVSINSETLRKTHKSASRQISHETAVTIFTEVADAPASPPTASASTSATDTPPRSRFARTSPDQASKPTNAPAFIGERNTQATSDRMPDPAAAPLPSQAGIEKENQDLETTQSDYKDGGLDTSPSVKTQESLPSSPDTLPPTLPDETPLIVQAPTSPPASETLLQGSSPVDVPVTRDSSSKNEIKPTPPKLPDPTNHSPTAQETQKSITATPPKNPAFSGYQRKAAIVGSISRTGRSALDVADSPLGRYQAAISRAVEQEWQRNCVRHRDFITPGFLTVRFFVETSGRVRTVRFVGDMETGEVQKGFTLNAIRDADIPAMPSSLKKEFKNEPLELIFNFLF